MGNSEIWLFWYQYIKTPLLAERNSQGKVLNECSGEISLCIYLMLTFFPRHSYCHRGTQGLWVVEGDLKSSSLTSLLGQGQLQLVAQGCVHLCSEYLQGWTLHNLSGKLVPVFDDPHSKKVFLTFTGNFRCFNLCPLPFVLSLGMTERSQATSSSFPLIWYLYISIRSPWAFSSPGWTVPSWILSSPEECPGHQWAC